MVNLLSSLCRYRQPVYLYCVEELAQLGIRTFPVSVQRALFSRILMWVMSWLHGVCSSGWRSLRFAPLEFPAVADFEMYDCAG